MTIRLSLADKISTTIIVVGIFGIALVYYISDSYKQLAYQHHTQSIQQLAYLEADDLIDKLKANSLDLAFAIEKNNNFSRDFEYGYKEDLTQLLDNQFHQYFVTAGVIKLLKIYIMDTSFNLISASKEGVETNIDGEIICPELSQLALTRHGSEQLQTLSRICLYKSHPVFAMIVPFGGLNPKGYMQVVTDLAYSLQKIDRSLAMPIQIKLLDGQIIYQSENWQTTFDDDLLDLLLPIYSDDNRIILNISLKSDVGSFNKEITEHRNWVMALAFFSTALTVIIVLIILQRSTIPLLTRINDVLEKIHLHSHTNGNSDRLLFEQLLEKIVQLKQKSGTSFSVMLLDLNDFKKINSLYGQTMGDRLLLEIELRLASILRESDLISWVGTDTPGHKLLPSNSHTKYRSTIARLGGDEFGLLLPSAHTEKQATHVAQRIIETFHKPFKVNEHSIKIECKIGISIYPKDGDDEKLLIRNADKAMHHAKQQKLGMAVFQG